MRLVYVLLSPTFGMHQYTADLANRVSEHGLSTHLVTTTRVVRDRYAPDVVIHTPVTTNNTGLSTEGLRIRKQQEVVATIRDLQPDLVHFTGPHLWNVPMVRALRASRIPVVHTLHDMDPHHGTHYGAFLRVWNRLIIHSADHILIHGYTYLERLLAMGLSETKVTFTPLLFLFLGWPNHQVATAQTVVEYEPWALFFGRMEEYKGIDYLLTAAAMMNGSGSDSPRLILAGPGNLSSLWAESVPAGVELRNRLIDDNEALELFRRCGMVVLPYVDATQSSIIAAAYYFRKPVVVTRTGALPEYVEEGHTGCVVEPDHPVALARCLERMLSEPTQMARMGNAGRALYDRWRIEETETILDMYQQLDKNSAE